MKKKCNRLDGLCDLTEQEKEERDNQARAWMNQRKIERVAIASFGTEILTLGI